MNKAQEKETIKLLESMVKCLYILAQQQKQILNEVRK